MRLLLKFDDPEFRFHVKMFDARSGKRLKRFVKLKGATELNIPLQGGPGVVLTISDANPKLYHLSSQYRVSMELN